MTLETLFNRFLRAINAHKLLWKDKYNSPRVSLPPTICIMGRYYHLKHDEWWEEYLWVHLYHNGDYNRAKQAWPWVNGLTKKSSWVDYKGLKNKLYKIFI